jgi:hydroxyquinol 1,2-dioxygenase
VPEIRQLNPNTITDAVLDQMAKTPDPRLKEIMTAAVKHLHAFARETNLTPAEWIRGIEFMTQVGKMCTPERQEFILLSDTVGLSALVNLMHDRTAIEEGTDTSLLGPFFRENTPKLERGAQIAKTADGPEAALWGQVTDVRGAPLANATVSVWQTSAHGLYDVQLEGAPVDYRGVVETDAEGRYWLRTVLPIGYSIPMDGPVGALAKAQARHGMRPAHIHCLVGKPQYRELITALYLKGDPHLADDTVFGVSKDLVAEVKSADPGCPLPGMPSIRFDMRLAREGAIDKAMGRVGADPAAIVKSDGGIAAGYGTPATATVPKLTVTVPTPKARKGFFSGLFGNG